MKKNKKVISLILMLILIFTMTPSVAFAAEKAVATDIRLSEVEGSADIMNANGKALKYKADMKLLSGYTIKTAKNSYAYITLDDSKAIKLDSLTQVEISKSGKKLEVVLKSGDIFFNVTQKLSNDESLNIKTSNLTTGIRGTSGVLTKSEETEQMVLFTGQAQVSQNGTTNPQKLTINPFEVAYAQYVVDTEVVVADDLTPIVTVANDAMAADMAIATLSKEFIMDEFEKAKDRMMEGQRDEQVYGDLREEIVSALNAKKESLAQSGDEMKFDIKQGENTTFIFENDGREIDIKTEPLVTQTNDLVAQKEEKIAEQMAEVAKAKENAGTTTVFESAPATTGGSGSGGGSARPATSEYAAVFTFVNDENGGRYDMEFFIDPEGNSTPSRTLESVLAKLEPVEEPELANIPVEEAWLTNASYTLEEIDEENYFYYLFENANILTSKKILFKNSHSDIVAPLPCYSFYGEGEYFIDGEFEYIGPSALEIEDKATLTLLRGAHFTIKNVDEYSDCPNFYISGKGSLIVKENATLECAGRIYIWHAYDLEIDAYGKIENFGTIIAYAAEVSHFINHKNAVATFTYALDLSNDISVDNSGTINIGSFEDYSMGVLTDRDERDPDPENPLPEPKGIVNIGEINVYGQVDLDTCKIDNRANANIMIESEEEYGISMRGRIKNSGTIKINAKYDVTLGSIENTNTGTDTIGLDVSALNILLNFGFDGACNSTNSGIMRLYAQAEDYNAIRISGGNDERENGTFTNKGDIFIYPSITFDPNVDFIQSAGHFAIFNREYGSIAFGDAPHAFIFNGGFFVRTIDEENLEELTQLAQIAHVFKSIEDPQFYNVSENDDCYIGDIKLTPEIISYESEDEGTVYYVQITGTKIEPVDPGSQDPDPVDPGSQDPDPVDPGSQDPDPVDPGSQDPDPVDTGSQDPDPVDPGSQDPDPVDTGSQDPDPQDPPAAVVDVPPAVPSTFAVVLDYLPETSQYGITYNFSEEEEAVFMQELGDVPASGFTNLADLQDYFLKTMYDGTLGRVLNGKDVLIKNTSENPVNIASSIPIQNNMNFYMQGKFVKNEEGDYDINIQDGSSLMLCENSSITITQECPINVGGVLHIHTTATIDTISKVITPSSSGEINNYGTLKSTYNEEYGCQVIKFINHTGASADIANLQTWGVAPIVSNAGILTAGAIDTQRSGAEFENTGSFVVKDRSCFRNSSLKNLGKDSSFSYTFVAPDNAALDFEGDIVNEGSLTLSSPYYLSIASLINRGYAYIMANSRNEGIATLGSFYNEDEAELVVNAYSIYITPSENELQTYTIENHGRIKFNAQRYIGIQSLRNTDWVKFINNGTLDINQLFSLDEKAYFIQQSGDVVQNNYYNFDPQKNYELQTGVFTGYVENVEFVDGRVLKYYCNNYEDYAADISTVHDMLKYALDDKSQIVDPQTQEKPSVYTVLENEAQQKTFYIGDVEITAEAESIVPIDDPWGNGLNAEAPEEEWNKWIIVEKAPSRI